MSQAPANVAPSRTSAGPQEEAAQWSDPKVRAQVLSGTRIKVAVVCLSLALVAVLSVTMVLSVKRIFEWLTPLTHNDLEWKALRGVAELARATDLGIILHDEQLLRTSVASYQADSEVRQILIQDTSGETIYAHHKDPQIDSSIFIGAPHTLSERDDNMLRAWAGVEVEGQPVGRLGIALSTKRLRAGQNLYLQIVAVALAAGVLAVLISLLFVRFYVSPLITVTKRAFLDLEHKTSEALEATRVKSEFLANMSHEIRTPLNGVIGMLGLLVRSDLDPVQRRRAEISESSARSLLALINDVLDFSKLESGHFVLQPIDCELSSLIQNRIELLAIKAHAKQLEIIYHPVGPVPHTVRLDPDRFTQVLTNLVGNAIKFTDEGEVVITVEASPLADASRTIDLRVAVSDTGPGIADEDKKRLFRSFSQIDGSSTRSHEGTGLGLAISKQLVGLMDGEIGVESQVGEGSTFWFTARCPVVKVTTDHVKFPAVTPAPRVLVVDGNDTCRSLLHDQLQRWGFDVASAADYAGAAALVRAGAPANAFESIIVDLRLQGDAGEPISDALIDAGASAARIIQMTPALWTPDASARESDVFLTKPIRLSELYAQLLQRPSSASLLAKPGGSIAKRRGHILVVDDNEVNRLLTEELLHELDHSCDLASNGYEAVERATARHYDAILMDCQMPGMNGYQATHEIRTHEGALRRTPIIALTAHAFTGEVQKVKAAGMDDFLTKPVSPRLLDTTLQKWMVEREPARSRPAASPESSGHLRNSRTQPPLEPPQAPTTEVTSIRPIATAEQLAPQACVLDERRRSARLVEVFLRRVPEQVAELLEVSRGDDLEPIRAAAHKLKGSTSSIGALRMSQLCEAMQFAAERGEGEQHLVELSQQVSAQFELVRERLETEAKSAKA